MINVKWKAQQNMADDEDNSIEMDVTPSPPPPPLVQPPAARKRRVRVTDDDKSN